MLVVSEYLKEKKQKLKQLEKQYQTLSFQRDELLREIEEFNDEYNLKFKDLLNEILNLKEENVYKKILLRKLKKQKLLNKDVLKQLEEKKYKLQAKLDKIKFDLKYHNDDEEMLLVQKRELEIALKEINSQLEFIKQEEFKLDQEEKIKSEEDLEYEYQEAKDDKEEFDKEIEETQKREKLDKNELKELKKLYRKLSKMIHPDVVNEEYKQEAQNIMAKLNELYKQHKLDEIKKMFLEINNKTFIFHSDTLSTEEEIQQQIYVMKDKIGAVLKEIDEIKSSEIFEIMENKENYFKEIKEQLEARLNDLKSEKSYLDINIMKYQDF